VLVNWGGRAGETKKTNNSVHGPIQVPRKNSVEQCQEQLAHLPVHVQNLTYS